MKSPRILTILFIACAVISNSAQAFDYAQKLGLGAGLGASIPVGPRSFSENAATGVSGAAWARYHVTSAWALQASYNRFGFAEVPTRVNAFEFEAHYRFLRTDIWTPVLGLGAGASQVRERGIGSNSKLIFSPLITLGIEYSVTQNIVLGAYTKYLNVVYTSQSQKEVQAIAPQLGVTFYLGGCGQCSETPVVQATQGAPVDSDRDGVLDTEDRCPQTPAGTSVNEYGCARDEKAQIRIQIEFAAGKSDVRPQFHAELLRLAEFMKKYESVKVEIAGHTDSTGNAANNKKLSQARAESVQNYLVEKFEIAKARLQAVGYGQDQPVAPNTTGAGRKQNRRVVAIVTE